MTNPEKNNKHYWLLRLFYSENKTSHLKERLNVAHP